MTKKLPCGATGCCHVGYKHHHCEHCGVVVAEVGYAPQQYTPWIRPTYYPWYGTYSMASSASGPQSDNSDVLVRAFNGDHEHK